MPRRKGKIRMWMVIVIIGGVIAAIPAAGLLLTAPGRRELRELAIDPVDFSKLRDGTFVGDYIGAKDHFRDAKVRVTISGGHISDINILKGALDKNKEPAKLSGGLSMADLFENVMESQSLQVDVISGATLTSKAHLKALEHALEQAQMK